MAAIAIVLLACGIATNTLLFSALNVLGRTLAILAAAGAIGGACYLTIGRLIQPILYRVGLANLPTLGLTALVIVLTAAGALAIPLRDALRTDVAKILRSDSA